MNIVKIMGLIVLFLGLTGCFVQKAKEWDVKAKDGEIYTLKLMNLSNQKSISMLIEHAETIFARSFAPFHPEAGLKRYFKEHELDMKIPEGIKDVQAYKREKFAEIINKDREKIIDYAEQHLRMYFQEEEAPKVKKYIEKGELFAFVLFKKDFPVGCALFGRSFIQDFKKDQLVSLGEGVFYLKLVALDPTVQGKGLSRLLVFAILRLFPKLKQIKLRTEIQKDMFTGRPKNEKACFVYSKLGFKKFVESKVDYDKNERQFFVWTNPNAG